MRALQTRMRIGVAAMSALIAALCAAALPVASQTPAITTEPADRLAAADSTSVAVDATDKLATDIQETIARVPVTLKLQNGTSHTADMVVTHFRPSGPGPFPVVVLSHGRSAANRNDPARWRSLGLARFWTRRGFAVMVPTRVGYGALGQAVDPEAAGSCGTADFRPAVAAMATQIEAAVGFAATLPWVDRQRVVLSGVSYGGFGTVGAVARAIPGLVGAINFAGGLGGNPQLRAGDPCQGGRIKAIAADAGAKARAPMLWLYAENDRYWGEAWPRQWHEAFTAAGGQATFARFPAVGEDGHKLMSEGFTLWRPEVDRFLASLGFDIPRAKTDLPESPFADLAEVDKVPYLKPAARTDGYAKFLAADVPRAFALSPTGAWSWRSGNDAVEVAMARCQTHSRSPCALYAVDDRVVWKRDQR